ncbi:MAG TPA: type I pantothenate kinase [Acidimicrobiales bacterium]|nr:type I pantothenate kinase [Acidimicrobiales bacterium]
MDTRFESFSRDRWSALGEPLADRVSPSEVALLSATGAPVAVDEVTEVYWPLTQFLALRAAAARDLRCRTDAFLREDRPVAPFVIGIGGSVAVGKSTTARILQSLLSRGPSRPSVELLTTDGFLYPNAVLEERGLLMRKGFPESYDQRKLVETLAAIKAGRPEVETPVYSHHTYDILPGRSQVIRQPDMVIVEGLNVLQVTTKGASSPVTVSDFFDFSIYVDAAEEDVARWFTERLLGLRATALQEPDSFFHQYASMSDDQMRAMAAYVWSEINLVNLVENIAPTRGRAHLVVEKDGNHRICRILLRRA